MHRPAGDHPRRRGHQSHQRQRGDGFARSALANDAQAFALFDMQIDTAHGAVDTILDMKLRLQPLHLQQPLAGGFRHRALTIHLRRCHRPRQRAGFQPRIERIAHPVTQQVDRHDDDQDHHSRHDRGMRIGNQRRPRLAQHRAQIRLRRLAPKPRNDRPAVSRIIQPMVVDMAITITGITLGRISDSMIRLFDNPRQLCRIDKLAYARCPR